LNGRANEGRVRETIINAPRYGLRRQLPGGNESGEQQTAANSRQAGCKVDVREHATELHDMPQDGNRSSSIHQGLRLLPATAA
jgi:hypothetical protein